ncbi:MAG: universal stress protein [Anderseniella sp.]|nr:universal stress protein [Anderseniella sp.]
MSVRRILVPVRLDGKGENVLDHAMALAGKNSHIEVVHCRPGPKDLIPFGVAVPSILREQITKSGDELADQEEKRVVQLFEDYAKSRKLKVVGVGEAHPKNAMSATFRVERGKQANIVSLRGRLADVVAVAKPDRDRAIGRNTLEAALVNTGSLVMMCPENAPPKRIGEKIAIAWNGSREAARAMTLALPLMAAAKKVSVMTVAGEKLELTGSHVLSYLNDHDINGEHLEIKAGHNIGESLVAGAGTCGADCLLMGAYGSSRGRELVLGGATQHVVDHASIPVLMAH